MDQFRAGAGARAAGPDDLPRRNLKKRPAPVDCFFTSADEVDDGSVGGARGPSAKGGIDDVDAPCAGRVHDAGDHGGRDRAVHDDEAAGSHAGDDALVALDHIPDLLVVRDADEDDVRPGGDLSGRARALRAIGYQHLDGVCATVEDDSRVAGGLQVARQRRALLTEADEARHCRCGGHYFGSSRKASTRLLNSSAFSH